MNKIYDTNTECKESPTPLKCYGYDIWCESRYVCFYTSCCHGMFDKPTHTGIMQHPYGLFAAFLRHEEYRSAPYELALSFVWALTTFVQTSPNGTQKCDVTGH